MTGRPAAQRRAGLAGPRAEKTVSLALQGGGAHGAYTWGVLDAIIEDGRLAIEAITGASAGSMNAVVMVDGWQEGGPDGARARLESFWRRVSPDGGLFDIQRDMLDGLLGFWSQAASPFDAWTRTWQQSFSPSQANPLDLNPLRSTLNSVVDFERVRSADINLFVAATSVWTGKIRLFETGELAADHVMASACLPSVFRAVEIGGEPFWDGGYSGNPAIFPLFYHAHCDDVLLVQINPIERRETPTGTFAIQDRLTEINFNAGLLRELRVIEFVARLIDEGKLSDQDYKRVLMHRIGGDGSLEGLSASSRLTAEFGFLLRLRDLGRAAAQGWLAQHYDAIGQRSTLDLKAAYS